MRLDFSFSIGNNFRDNGRYRQGFGDGGRNHMFREFSSCTPNFLRAMTGRNASGSSDLSRYGFAGGINDFFPGMMFQKEYRCRGRIPRHYWDGGGSGERFSSRYGGRERNYRYQRDPFEQSSRGARRRVSDRDYGSTLFRPNDNFRTPDGQRVTEAQSKIANSGAEVAKIMNRTGRCATGVQRALTRIGVGDFMGKGHGWDLRNALINSGKFERVDPRDMQVGDVIFRKGGYVRLRNGGMAGHAAIISGKDKNGFIESSDHTKRFNLNNSAYTDLVVLRYKG